MADRLDDLICTFHPGASAMETLSILLLGWVIFGALLTLIGKFLYAKLLDGSRESPSSGVHSESPTSPSAVSKTEGALGGSGGGKPSERFANLTKPLKLGSNQGSVKAKSVPKSQPTDQTNFVIPFDVKLPTISGPDTESVKWVNAALAWLHIHPNALNDLIALWRDSLNVETKKSAPETGVLVDFQQIVFDHDKPPVLNNIFCECSSSDNITVTGDWDSSFVVLVRARRPRGESEAVSDYRINVNKLRGRLNSSCITQDMTAHAKFDGWPEVRLQLFEDNPTGDKDELYLQDLLLESVSSALRLAVLDLKLSKFQDFPRFHRPNIAAEPILPVHYDSMLNRPLISAGKSKQLLVKVVKANGLGSGKGCKEVYCNIEMDQPFQTHTTEIKSDTDNPFWDESFLFELRPDTAEILFEIFDRARGRNEIFLGLGIVGMEELLMNPSQRQIIPLQSRPYEDDQVSGSLTVEFLFVDPRDFAEGMEGLLQTGRSRPTSPNGHVLNLNKPSYDRSPSNESGRISPSGLVRRDSYHRATRTATELQLVNGSDPMTQSVLRDRADLEYRRSAPTGPARSTLVIQSAHRQTSLPLLKVALHNGIWREVESVSAPSSPFKQHAEEGPLAAGDYPDPLRDIDMSNFPTGSMSSSLSSREEMERGRGRHKKRGSFFKSLKERLSRSKTRSRSVDPGAPRDDSLNRDEALLRSVSADRAQSIPASMSASHLLVVPGSSHAHPDVDSARSSLSEASGVSNASTRTYLDEASTLILEVLENGVKRHYLIPMAIAEKKHWKKKGTKLHVYNDHVFVAKHLPGTLPCQVCGLTITRRMGKQGYECRDCHLRCHKPCHVRVDHLCPNSSVKDMEPAFLVEPRLDRKSRRN